jgi:hypothetical protein
MTSIAKRMIVWAPGIYIDRNGVCWQGHTRLVTTNVISKLGVKQIAVVIDGTTHPVWRLLSGIWYRGAMVLPRDGNAMDYSADNTIVLSKVTSMKISDPDEMLKIWVTYEREKVGCWDLAASTGLCFYTVDEFRVFIGDVLLAGVR